jgi:AcrR family transcriptional regulator
MQELTRREKERLMHEEEIVLAAEIVFCRHGYERTSIDEIARDVKFTRRTIYQYFKNKEDLYYAVALRGFKRLSEYFSKAIRQGENGFDKFYQAGLAYYQFYKDFPGPFHLMNRIGFVKAIDSATPKYRELMALNEVMFRDLGTIIIEGKKDGSIRGDLDPVKGVYSLTFIVTGFIHEISMAGQSFAASRNIDFDEIVKYAFDILADSFRPKQR